MAIVLESKNIASPVVVALLILILFALSQSRSSSAFSAAIFPHKAPAAIPIVVNIPIRGATLTQSTASENDVVIVISMFVFLLFCIVL